jgi:TolB protein
MIFKKSSSLLVLMALAAMVVISAGPASATFPGKNGRIAFVKGIDIGSALGDIFTINPNGSDVKKLTSFEPGGGTCCHSWSPDGRRLVFSLFAPATGPGRLWVMNADGTNQHLLLQDPSFSDIQPSFSPDGNRIVFVRCGAVNCAIYRVQANGTQLTAITSFNANPDISDFHPVYSPDGRTIAFTSISRGGIIAAVFLMNDDGSNIRELTPPEFMGWRPDWSPKGGEVVFSTDFALSVLDEEVWLIDADGMPKRLTNNNSDYDGYFKGRHDLFPSWAPQGNAIVFERDSPTFNKSGIYIMNPDGTGEKLVLQGLPRKSVEIPLTTKAWKHLAKHALRLLLMTGIEPRWGPASK